MNKHFAPTSYQKGFAALPVIIAAVVIVAVIGGGTVAYQVQKRGHNQKIEEIQEELESLKQAVEDQEEEEEEEIIEEEEPTPEPTPVPISAPAPKPQPVQRVGGTTATATPVPTPQWSKREQCETYALKKKVEIRDRVPEVKEEWMNHPTIIEVQQRRNSLYSQLYDLTCMVDPFGLLHPATAAQYEASCLQNIRDNIAELDREIANFVHTLETELAKVPEETYEKELSDCLNR